MLLRLTVGFHFYKEGTSKLQSGDFTAEYFLRGAKGPLAPYFTRMIRDVDGKERLCVEATESASGEKQFRFNTELTFALWDDFVDKAYHHYGFGSVDLQNEISAKRKQFGEQIRDARASEDKSVNTALLEQQRREGEESILLIRRQPEKADRILENHNQQLLEWLNVNRAEIFSHYGTENRLQGFDRDGANRARVATHVDSLRKQVDEIRSDRERKLAGWKGDVESIWDSLEAQINDLATDKQAEQKPVRLHRHFDQPNSNLKMFDRFIPWFDTIVGVLLILGLFTRLASLAGAGFLAAVIATQPPWIPGTTDTYYQTIELAALLVIFATCAGRMGGLDYFFSRRRTKRIENE